MAVTLPPGVDAGGFQRALRAFKGVVGVRGDWFALLTGDVERLTGRKPIGLPTLFDRYRDDILTLAGHPAEPLP